MIFSASPPGAHRPPVHLLRLFSVLALAFIASCGGEDGAPEQTTGPGPPPLVVTGGAFDVTSREVFNTCATVANYTGTYDVSMNDGEFTMGTDWTGTWDAAKVTGSGESERTENTYRYCTVRTWTEVSITFTTEDEFNGRIIFRQRVNGDCREPCQTTWLIDGVRVPTTP